MTDYSSPWEEGAPVGTARASRAFAGAVGSVRSGVEGVVKSLLGIL